MRTLARPDSCLIAMLLFGGQTGSDGNIQATDLNDIWLLRI
jgi:hypothetical protein